MLNRQVNEGKRAVLRRFAVLGVATLFTGLGGGDDGEDDSSGLGDARDATVGYAAPIPGAHFSEVHNNLQLGTGETQYHFQDPVDNGTLEVSRGDDYKRFFPADRFSEFEQATLGYLHHNTPHGMLAHPLYDPAATGSELAARLSVSRVAVSTYAEELDAVGFFSCKGGYAVCNPETVVTLLIRYTDSFGSDAATFADDAADLVRFNS